MRVAFDHYLLILKRVSDKKSAEKAADMAGDDEDVEAAIMRKMVS